VRANNFGLDEAPVRSTRRLVTPPTEHIMNIALAEPNSELSSIPRLFVGSFHAWFNRFLSRSRPQRPLTAAARTTNSSGTR
jgi:hypothetical protein